MAARTPSAWSTPSSSLGSSSGNFNFSDFSYEPSRFSTSVYTNPDTSRIYENVFGASSAPKYDFSTSFDPGSISRAYSPSTPKSDAPSWMDFGKAALDIASKWRGTSSSGSSGASDKMQSISSPGSEIRDLGSGFKLIQRAPITEQTSKSSQGGGGFLGPVGSLVGAGVGALVGGPPGASLGMGIGGAAGGAASSLFG